MRGRESVDTIPGLWSMGADYWYEGVVSGRDLDPEIIFLKTLKHYWDANDVFFMLVDLLTFRIGSLIHVERLLKLSQSGLLTNDETILLIVTCDRLVLGGDHRFRIIRRKLYSKGMTLHKLPKLHGGKHIVKAHGAEPGFLEFGAKVRKFVEPSEKKLHPLKTIFSRNPWLKMRAIFGPNFRADISYLILSNQAKTAYQAGKIAGCGNTSAYRLMKYIKEFDNLKALLKVT